MEGLFGILLVVTVVSVVSLIWSNVEETQFRAEAIERGYAQYCPHNGKWAWKGECDE